MYLLLAMVKKIFILILGVFGLFNASAQKTKTDVLVTGSNPSGTMSLEKTIALVCYVGNKSEVAVRAAVEKKWSTDFRKEGVLDYKKAVSRMTFSILLNDYLRPVDVSIDRTGRITR